MDERISRVAVVGASGFIGSTVSSALRNRGAEVVSVRAPRLRGADINTTNAELAATKLRPVMASVGAIVNAAGMSDATGQDEEALYGANAAVPALLASLAKESGTRLVHISSAAVQGRRKVLDDSMEWLPFSPYSRSKVEGERQIVDIGGRFVIYRPPGVHASNRAVTQSLARVACSSLAVVASPGSAPSPQALAPNVGDAVAWLALSALEPPHVVIHPSEGVTAASLLSDLGGREPRRIPHRLARATVGIAFLLGRANPGILGYARRLEVLLFGQGQAESWLKENGWHPPLGPESWQQLGTVLQREIRLES